MRSERLTILVTPDEKAAMTKMADRLKMSVGELLRYGFELAQEIGSPADLEALAAHVSRDMDRTARLLDEANAALEETLRTTRGHSLAAE